MNTEINEVLEDSDYEALVEEGYDESQAWEIALLNS